MSRNIVEVYPSQARTASPADAEVQVPPDAASCLLLIDVTAIALTPSVTVNVNGVVPGSGTQFPLLSSAAITGVGVTALEIGPGIAEAANKSVDVLLPEKLVVDPAHADADSITYSIVAVFY